MRLMGMLAAVPESLAFGLDQLAAPLAAKVWANELEREIDTQGETLARVIEAVLLAKRYGIVTRYSAILALESDELYRSLDIQQIRRDPAGIALDPPEISKADEKRIGANGGDGDGDGDGDGGDDSSWDGNGGDDGQNSGGGDGGDDPAVDEGFSDGGCRASRGTGSLPAWLLLAAVGLACRPRRRALARWACAQAAGNDQSATPAH